MWQQLSSQPAAAAAATSSDMLAAQSSSSEQGQLQIQVLAMPDDALVNRMVSAAAAARSACMHACLQPSALTCPVAAHTGGTDGSAAR